ncbi:pyrophosphate--fructose 6-phosphate 1-phosphotransferase subunit alpha-like [Lathyrus oleraceus]|uniref:pyrophosphate--fructose 6-phosphate 1-phosphotransferase subunit alpha-like n=1 Tax=Pisum sativum TaxID=3888 RepID=UPI0021D0B279|nr:pyrophosphate--fructose 6-phosphate 1-phosphotransferase subunit alpha-like [Pisum sativum]
MVILGEEFAQPKLTIFEISPKVSDAVQARAEQDKYHGVILLLEGLAESIPEIHALLKEIHILLQQGVAADKIFVHLSPWASTLVEFLPPFIRRQLLPYAEPDDSTQSSQIGTKKILAYPMEAKINKFQKEITQERKK